MQSKIELVMVKPEKNYYQLNRQEFKKKHTIMTQQELSQEDETATSDPETAIDVYVEEDDVKSGESTPKDKVKVISRSIAEQVKI